jgi:hypothetical protein
VVMMMNMMIMKARVKKKMKQVTMMTRILHVMLAMHAVLLIFEKS